MVRDRRRDLSGTAYPTTGTRVSWTQIYSRGGRRSRHGLLICALAIQITQLMSVRWYKVLNLPLLVQA